jgi:DNA-binding IclR family transcriptional regulator
VLARAAPFRRSIGTSASLSTWVFYAESQAVNTHWILRSFRLDNVIRRSDPLLRAAVPIMRELTGRTACDCALTALFGRTVMDIHSEHGTDACRGQPVEMFRGSAAKVILSPQPATWQKRIYQTHAAEKAEHGMGVDWASFYAP